MTVIAEYLPIVMAVAAFLVVGLLLLGIIQYRRMQANRLAAIDKIRASAKKAETVYTLTGAEVRNPVLRLLGELGTRIAGKKRTDLSTMRPIFLKAGIRYSNAPAVFWGVRILLAGLLPAMLLVSLGLFPKFSTETRLLVLAFTVVALIGFYLPNLWLLLKAARRKEKIRDGFPDALDLLVVCVEAGMGLDGAIHRVAREIELDNRALSEELNLMNLELRAGKSRRDALKNLAARTDLEDVNSLASLLIQTDKLGTSVSQALRVYSDTFRTKRYMKAEEQAAKIPVKLTIPLILFVFPALLVTIMGPAVIRIARVLLPALGR